MPRASWQAYFLESIVVIFWRASALIPTTKSVHVIHLQIRRSPAHLMAPDAVFANHRGQKRRTYAVVANREASLEVEI